MTKFTRGKSSHQRVATGSTEWEDFKKFKTPKTQKSEERVRKDNKTPPSSSPQDVPSTSSAPGRGRGGRGRGQPRNFAQRRGNKDGWKGSRGPSTQGSSPGSSGLEGAWYTRPDQDRDEGKSFNKVTPKESGGDGEDSKKGKSNTVKIFGSFWVGKEDADRLQKMAKRLKEEGLPRKDILSMLQGERRKAEKAAKRQRDKTCFKCRRFGHVLAECPNNSSNGTNTSDGGVGDELVAGSDGDICFKCGSTEHSSRNCKRKGEKFSFANCFVCRETGHIARQCPKNTKGVYPGGGSCDECGAITHLKKDCPEAKNGGGNFGNDADTVVGRIENPFVSPEMEPAVAMELSGDDEESEDAEERHPLKSKPKPNLKRHRVEEELPNQNPFNADADSIPKKKRKVGNNDTDNKVQGDKVESINIAKATVPPKKKKRVVKF